MWYTVEIIKKIKPKYIIWENVKNVLSDKHKHNFDKYLEILRDSGYKNHSKVINAKHWGIPQNRERVFVVSIREDINKDFKFPISSLKSQQSLFNTNVIDIEPKILADILENEVDEKYYLSDEYMERFIKSLDDEKLQDELAKLLPAYMLPNRFIHVEEIPVTQNGKVDKAKLPDPNSQFTNNSAYQAPRNDLEALISQTWQDVLLIRVIGVFDSFLALGGDSLAAIRITSRMEEQLGLEIPLRELFEHPTIAGYSDSIATILQSELD
jgi:site-specific DNA-cytosine methylase